MTPLRPAERPTMGARVPRAVRWPRLHAVGVLTACMVVLPPLAWLAWAALRVLLLQGPAAVDAVALVLLDRSVRLAALAAGLAVLMGVPYGWLVARFRPPGERLWMPLSLAPLLLPPYAGTLAWLLLFRREGVLNQSLGQSGWIREPLSIHGSLPVAAAVLAFSYWPVVAWATTFAARSVPAPLEDEARLHLSASRAALLAAGPALARALPAAAFLVFLLALADFGAANSLGLSTYPVEIVNRFQVARDAGAVARLALPLLLLVVPLVVVQNRWLRRAPAGEGEPARRRIRSPLGAALGGVWCSLVLGVSAVMPLGTLFAHSIPLGTYGDVWAESADHFINTFTASASAAALATAAALLFGWGAYRRRHPVLDALMTLPYALPASLVAMAMIQLLNRPGPLGELYTSPLALVWTYAALFFPFAHKALQPAWGRVEGSLVEEGAMLGAGPWEQFVTAAWPVVRPYAYAGGGMVALLSAREIDATALLRVPGYDTAAFRIYDYLHFDPGPKVAALSILLVLASLAAAAALWLAARDWRGV